MGTKQSKEIDVNIGRLGPNESLKRKTKMDDRRIDADNRTRAKQREAAIKEYFE